MPRFALSVEQIDALHALAHDDDSHRLPTSDSPDGFMLGYTIDTIDDDDVVPAIRVYAESDAAPTHTIHADGTITPRP